MSWYNTYYTNNIDISKIDQYKICFEIEKEDDENNLEKEYLKSLEKIEFIHQQEDIQIFLDSKNSLDLLEEQLNVIKLLSKYTLQNNYLNLIFFLKCLDILIITSSILMKRIDQTEVIHKSKNFSNYIPRCSYKFCNFKDECFYNYSNKTKNVCYQDHYVHNMVNADLTTLKEYIQLKFSDNNLVIPNKEILKTINTLCFVIEHMYTELKSRCLYSKEDEIEKEHHIKKNSN